MPASARVRSACGHLCRTPPVAPARAQAGHVDHHDHAGHHQKTAGKLAATGDRTLVMVGACLIGGIVIIVLGIIWKRRR